MGSLVHDIIYVEKYTLEIAHEKIYEDRNRPVMCGIVSMRHRIFLFSGSEMRIYRYMLLLGKIPFHISKMEQQRKSHFNVPWELALIIKIKLSTLNQIKFFLREFCLQF